MLKRFLWVGLVCLPLIAQDWFFEEVSAQAGLVFEHRYSGNTEPEFMAGGAAVADYDRDGDLDLMVVAGSRGRNALFQNQGDGTFIDVAEAAGVVFPDRFDNAPNFGDLNGDGWPDLFLGAIKGGGPKILLNNGAGGFVDATAASGLTVSADVYGVTFGDPDRDGDLDLMLAYWAQHHEGYYWRNDGTGRFTMADAAVGLDQALLGVNAFTPSFSDINNDGWPDLLVVADFRTTTYFLNRGGGFFVEGDRTPITDGNGMGSALGDIDNDGDLDWFVSSVGVVEGNPNQTSTGNRMYRNLGDGRFEDATDACGVREGHWGWGATFGDFDNDGDLDLFHVNGFLGSFSAGYDRDATKLFVNDGTGRYAEQAVARGIDDRLQGRGVVSWDYDGDGDLDLLVANNAGPLQLFRNNGGNQNHWLQVSLLRDGREDLAIGARLRLETGGGVIVRELRNGGNYVSQNPAVAHFGLGAATEVTRLTVRWPDGMETSYGPFAVDQALVLERDSGAACGVDHRPRRLVHVTAAAGGFTTDVRLVNRGAVPAWVDLTALDAQGAWLAHRQDVLAAGAATVIDGVGGFGEVKPAQVLVTAPTDVSAQAGYRHGQALASLATVPVANETRRRFSFYSGNPELVFDGLVLVNAAEAAARVQLQRFDMSGALLDDHILHESLGPGVKTTQLLSDWVATLNEGDRIDIISDKPLFSLVLRGTWPGVTPALLVVVPVVGDRVR